MVIFPLQMGTFQCHISASCPRPQSKKQEQAGKGTPRAQDQLRHVGWLSSARGQPHILEEHYQIPSLLPVSISLPASPFIHEYEAILQEN